MLVPELDDPDPEFDVLDDVLAEVVELVLALTVVVEVVG